MRGPRLNRLRALGYTNHRNHQDIHSMRQRESEISASLPPARSDADAAARAPSPTKEQAGVTLSELLVVLTILVLLIGLVGPAVMRQLGSAKQKVASQSIERLAGVLDLYRLDVGSYPTTAEGLAALNAGPA